MDWGSARLARRPKLTNTDSPALRTYLRTIKLPPAQSDSPAMSIPFILAPLFVQVVLTFVLMFWMAGRRTVAIRGGVVHPRDVALREPNWPLPATQVANAYHNQLELPVLFYVLTI